MSSDSGNGTTAATFQLDETPDGPWRLALSGRLDVDSTGVLWNPLSDRLASSRPRKLVVDAADLSYCDGAGIGLLFHVELLQRAWNGEVELENLSERFSKVLERYDTADYEHRPQVDATCSCLPEQVGRAAESLLGQLRDLVAFIGEVSTGAARALARPSGMRWREAFLTAEKAGVDAVPIIVLISFLIGLIMAFQSIIPMRQFGAEIFVADLVALSVVKELGPLMTAIILAGRSGSAFAAEIGTMKVNEEVNALRTMGVDPVRYLVVPRVIAAALVTPLLAVLANAFGLIGGAVVAMSLEIPLVIYIDRAHDILSASDLVGGLVKAFVFGMLVAGAGCLRGLQTARGARAVGDSTTSSVVTSIVLIIVADGVFSVVYYQLGI